MPHEWTVPPTDAAQHWERSLSPDASALFMHACWTAETLHYERMLALPPLEHL